MGGPGGSWGSFSVFFKKKFFFKFWGALGGSWGSFSVFFKKKFFLKFFFKFFFSFGGPLGDLVGLFLLFHHFGWKIFHQFGSKNILSDLGFLKKVLDCCRSVANLVYDWTTSQDQVWTTEIFLDCPNIFKQKGLNCCKSVANLVYESNHCKV